MSLLGAHMSIQGGVHRAIERGSEAGCDAIQLFTKSSNQWRARSLGEEEVGLFHRKRGEHGISEAVAHDCYLINLASPDPALHARSAAAFAEEIERCDRIGLSALIAHPGAHMGAGPEAGFDRIASAIDAAFDRTPDSKTLVLLETTAGMGTSVGHRFEHLRAIIDRVKRSDRMGVCVDTCHVFAAGYDISTEKGYHAVMEDLDRVVGLERVRAFHLNDSKKGLGCRLDRHEHIGAGALGVTAFWCLLNDRRFEGLPMVLETPKGEDLSEDRANLALLRAQIGRRRPVKGPTAGSVTATHVTARAMVGRASREPATRRAR
jgi:deoxyribonuclease-4